VNTSVTEDRKQPQSRRRYGGKDRDDTEFRSPAQKDRDRVLYSPEFRRLAGITQVAAVHERHLIHNRLTHSLKVAQMGRRIAERLVSNDADLRRHLIPEVVEVAGLVHDIGHPPFGHAAERALSEIMDKVTGTDIGFEGNAQSFRIVTKICVRDTRTPGLDLTQATLAAILKYPQFYRPKDKPDLTDRTRGKKWGAYLTEADDFIFAMKDVPEGRVAGIRSPNAIVMDWADDISFATHDLEDFIHAGAVRPETLISEWQSFEKFVRDDLGPEPGFQPGVFRRACKFVEGAFRGSIKHPYDGSLTHRAELHALISHLIRTLDRGCLSTTESPYVWVRPYEQYVAEILKRVTTYYVVMNPNIRAAEEGQQRLIKSLHSMLVESTVSGASSSRHGLPGTFWELHELARKEEGDYIAPHRAAADYLCTLTEEQTVDLYGRMSGQRQANSLGVWLR
jgi:dGTPase